MSLFTVPANLLLLGEYAVLEPGGLGLTVAIERRISVTITGAPRLAIAGEWGGGREEWPPGEPSSLFACAAAAVSAALGCTLEELLRLPLGITVDSRVLYDEQGTKAGLGSSAAAAVAVCYALIDHVAAGRSGAARELPALSASPLEASFAAALAAHRAFQGGGSGYDVAASLFGGLGRFEGGRRPGFRPLSLPWLPPLLLFRGSRPVKTPHAVERYRQWKGLHAADAARFLEESNRSVEGFLASSSWQEGAVWLAASRRTAAELGDAIGVPARLDPPEPADRAGVIPGSTVKAVGAGNELGVLFLDPDVPAPRFEPAARVAPLPVASEGVKITSEEKELDANGI